MKSLYNVKFTFGDGSTYRMMIRGYFKSEADTLARTEFNYHFTKGEIFERGGVKKVDINQIDITHEEVQKYL